jgi:hypothetical protein
MADLDALLNDAADQHLPVQEIQRKPKEPLEIKPWLACTANVKPEIRDVWTSMVRQDLKAQVISKFQPSNAYRKWDSNIPPGPNKLLQELVRNAATRCQLDETKIAKLISNVNPITEKELGTQLQTAYKKLLLNDLKQSIVSDFNYNASNYPALSAQLS